MKLTSLKSRVKALWCPSTNLSVDLLYEHRDASQIKLAIDRQD